MFKTSLQAEHVGLPWGLIGGALAFTVLMAAGYMLVNPIL